ncbi:MAG: cobalt-precorrin-5B (C(1))-methyltransferase [candidate division NC10 bacterium]|nr:cobalt-precorrin-5B (C(1))-methyltransferase [Candidatus Rokubacteria bacterium]MBI2563067.1 cobalt-precorrin-5B (C(1))-methyltransferase [candidate division NC10 bacterium]
MPDEPKRGKALREGYSTGSCAAAAAKAAATALLGGTAQTEATLDLPIGRRVTFAVNACEIREGMARCSVIKDAGDDPDCTHGAEIFAEVRLRTEPGVGIDGGEGVARVTKGGLGLEIGEPAITRVPRRMITESVTAALEAGGHAGGAYVVIFVPRGLEMAKQTLNHRLGLIGGISILGTSGIVKPYSTAAYKVSIVNSIDVAVAEGLTEVVITTGGKSEEYAQRIWPLPEPAFVQMGDWVGFTLAYCRKKKVAKVDIAGMIGKLSKIADGEFYTHARQSAVNLEGLAAIAHSLGAASEVVEKIRHGNTAREAQEIVLAHGVGGFFDRITAKVSQNCRAYVEGAFAVETVLTDADGVVLGRAQAA